MKKFIMYLRRMSISSSFMSLNISVALVLQFMLRVFSGRLKLSPFLFDCTTYRGVFLSVYMLNSLLSSIFRIRIISSGINFRKRVMLSHRPNCTVSLNRNSTVLRMFSMLLSWVHSSMNFSM